MLKEDDSLLDDEPIEFKGGTLTLSTEDDIDELTFLNRQGSSMSFSLCFHKIQGCSLMLPWAGEDPKSFFCYRDELVSKVITEVKEYFTKDDPDYVQGIWLLTEISFWDNERERVVLITKEDLIVIKYDFIALKILSHYKVPLEIIDTVTIGDLVYPNGSLAPHIQGLTSGVIHVLKSCALKVAGNTFANANIHESINETFDITYFKARSRNVTGVRAMWNKGQPLKFSMKWNPFASNIPWATFTSHPLLWHKSADEENMRIYDVDFFVSRFVKAVQQISRSTMCQIQHNPILLQNYFGLLSIIHNRNSLGFFKVRGKFSF